ncbi:hypothetical protein H6F43_00510 [Leptolyngbya sp. FACHB-36]|uniref:hypothetical protein n=1 Tax=Leptolyngbya sp. FACHB-36 TaxID=2692808 RepID=UPI001681186C|nr:hypothetical protein [Leptolyngbya sp. FACHB-36]MBD2018665.1 hypothetical protein [Leptolyngbya sp. FACHB-36]
MQRDWGHDPRFSAENFGFQPTWLILQALEHGAKLRQEELHMAELGIAQLCALFVNANRDPKKGEPAKAKDFCHFTPKESEIQINGAACDAFFSLAPDEKLPAWALALAPVDKLKAQRKNRPAPKPRAWASEDEVLLILPRVKGDRAVCSLAFVGENVSGLVTLADVDSGTEFAIEVPTGKPRWIVDAEFDVAGGSDAEED